MGAGVATFGTRALAACASGLFFCLAALGGASAQVAAVPAPADGMAVLAERAIAMPIDGVKGAALQDTFTDRRTGGSHEALDIPAPRGTPVHAVDDGKLVKLFTSVPGGLTVYQFDPTGRLAYYYAHLDRYADNLQEGMTLRRGDVVGYVGTTGNAPPNVPHLHFAVFLLDADKRWWKGTAINPYPALRPLR
ncbi:M23 family metallopeptidase [Variovorax paradoxus]|uniref:M23 family metallopeptidase n=1 Tax=Variovorax paradoxus TaxID=34073 RepID=UPI00069A6275|nr:M23 family metallopeptidase [Variovorax paradoxus]